MNSRAMQLLVLTCMCLLQCGCGDEIPPPPSEAEMDAAAKPAVKPLEMDPKHSISIKGDRSVVIPNLVFVIQHSPAMGESYGLTLTCSRPTTEGARLVFGAFQTAQNRDALTKENIRYASGSLLDPTGNGIFMTTTAYQPKFASIKLTSLSKTDAEGTLSGEFYRFSLATPTARPTVVKLEGAFSAAVIEK